MRVSPAILLVLLAAFPAFAQGQVPPPSPANSSQIACAQIPQAQHFVDGLRPGPNTRAAQQHLDAAKHATSDRQCVDELGRVNYYARRSAEADKRIANASAHSVHHRRRVLCADAMHQNRPGGSDYHGPAVPGCPRVM